MSIAIVGAGVSGLARFNAAARDLLHLLVEFFDNPGMLSFRGRPRWRTVTGGSERYVEALLGTLERRLRLGTPTRPQPHTAHERA